MVDIFEKMCYEIFYRKTLWGTGGGQRVRVEVQVDSLDSQNPFLAEALVERISACGDMESLDWSHLVRNPFTNH